MRRIVFAPSFDAELLEISISIEQRFGARAADEFEARIRATAQTLAHTPMGTRHIPSDFTQLVRAQIGFSADSRTPRSISFTFATAAATRGAVLSSTECGDLSYSAHVQLILAPEGEDGLRHALARAQRSYARHGPRKA
jgi:plasmid stabilization system protein ParE